MTVPAPDVLRAVIDRRLHGCDNWAARGIRAPTWIDRERGYLAAFRAILDEHLLESQCCGGKWYPCATVRAVAAALTREDQ